MKLLVTLPSPFARKIRVVIEELGAADAVETVMITQATVPTNPVAEVSAANPLGKIPVLIVDGRLIADSAVIAEYLDARFGGGLIPAGDARWPALTLHAIADGIMEAGIEIRLEGLRPEPKRWSDWTEAHLRKIIAALDWAEREAALDGPFDLGQIGLACAIDWLAYRGVLAEPLAGRDRLAGWHRTIAARPSLQATAPR